MWRIIIYATIQSLMLAGAQVFLKLSLAKMPQFGWNTTFLKGFLTNWQFAICGILFGASSVFWMYIVKRYPLSVAYPMISLSYVFGTIAAIICFHEDVSYVKWIGIALIAAGCCLIAK